MSDLSENSRIKVGFAITVVGALFAFHVWLDNRFDRIEVHLDRIEARAGDRWPATSMRLFVSEFRRRNPTLDIPDIEPFLPREVSRDRASD